MEGKSSTFTNMETGSPYQKKNCCSKVRSLFTDCSFLKMYRIMRLVGIVCGISVIILNFLVIDHVLAEEFQNFRAFVTFVNLVFLLLISVCLTLAFFELGIILVWFSFLESWVGMGMSLIFLAVATSDKANNSKGYGEYVNIHIIDVICYSIMVVGFMFSVLGCCGGKSLRKRHLALERERKMQQNARQHAIVAEEKDAARV